MSNQLVGTVFERVIQEVCDSSQVDFEESGVDQQTLLDLRKSWQKKLSSLGVAQFPWDPPPPQAPAQPPNQQVLPPTSTVPSNAPRPPQPSPVHHQHVPPQPHPQHLQHPPHPQSIPPQGPPLQVPTPVGVAGGNPMGHSPQIKTEPGLNGHPSLPPMSHMMAAPPNAQSARERAQNLIQQRYGAAAANSVSQMQAQSHSPMSLPRPPQMQHMPNGQNHQIKQETGYHPVPHPSVSNSQTDGATGDALLDWKAEVARRREAAQRQGVKGEGVLRNHLRERMLQLEGGGLMVPLDERETQPKIATNATSTTPRAQFDGPGGDDTKEEDDEDAINSDLDDPDDLVAEDADDDDAVGQVMLCTYDKVQRVKNKWKCTLKDGILTTGGKEYVFHKGQGEFEW
ncbi:transcription factor IIA, alpha/beta subunit [Aspergillus karnatakaensis]|uniref:transcription initiation factor IIA large subunit n=1 Tax=Aspergillus karnatakaensis TaxID=1810916 RepID=UPI003CCD6419